MAPLPDELVKPLAVVDALFQQHISLETDAAPQSEWGERAHFVQKLNLDDEESFAKIPCINDVALAESVPPFSLVRYRGLVQDVFEPEIYAARVREVSEGDGVAAQGRLVTTKYRECYVSSPGHRIVELGRDGFGQRGACYCVPLPGEVAWARGSAAASASPAPRKKVAGQERPSTPTKAAAKRGRADEDDEMAAGEEASKAGRVAGDPASASAAMVMGGEEQRAEECCNADEFGLNFPLPWEERRGHGCSTACIVKLYDKDEEVVRLCDTVEIVGVLCVNPEIANLNDTPALGDTVLGSDARHPSTALVPRLHALMVRKLPFQHPLLQFTPDWLTEERLATAFQRSFAAGALAAARGVALETLTRHLAGDALAAEYVLMLLVSRSFDKRGGLSLGSWALNLAGWPDAADVRTLCRGTSDLVPRVVHLELSEETLSSQRWQPRKDFVANRLIAGQLQLAAGSLMVLDERGLTGHDKQRADGPQKVVEAVRSVVSGQSLPCEYGSYDVDIPLELQAMTVSRGRSKVAQGPADVTLPLRPTADPAGAVPAAPMDACRAADLRAARLLIGLVTRSPRPLKIPDDVADSFSKDFVAVREQLQVPAELCHSWMALARAHCLTYGEDELTMDRWRFVLGLEHERLKRCQQQNLLIA